MNSSSSDRDTSFANNPQSGIKFGAARICHSTRTFGLPQIGKRLCIFWHLQRISLYARWVLVRCLGSGSRYEKFRHRPFLVNRSSSRATGPLVQLHNVS